MIYRSAVPSAALRPWVRTLWYCRAPGLPHRSERVLPNGCIEIVIDLARERMNGAIVLGQRSRYAVVDTADMEEVAGIVIEPGGFGALFQDRADLLLDRSVPLDDLRPAARLVESLHEASGPAAKIAAMDSFLRGLLNERTRGSAIVAEALHLFRSHRLSVAACARSIGISERRLSQVFREQVGLAPRLWLRLERFQAVTRALHKKTDIPWATLALDCGYYDQSHFAHDFRAFSGIDPTTYSAYNGPWQNHVALP